MWQKEEKVWIELMPSNFGKPFLFSPKIKSGIGEGMLLGGLMTYPTAGAGGALHTALAYDLAANASNADFTMIADSTAPTGGSRTRPSWITASP